MSPQTDDSSVWIPLSFLPPFHPDIQRRGWPKAAAARGGVDPRLWSVFSEPLLSLLTDRWPLRVMQNQNGIKKKKRVSLTTSVLAHPAPSARRRFEEWLHRPLTNNNSVTPHKPRKATKSLQKEGGGVGVGDSYVRSSKCQGFSWKLSLCYRCLKERQSSVRHTTGGFLPGCFPVTSLHRSRA